MAYCQTSYVKTIVAVYVSMNHMCKMEMSTKWQNKPDRTANTVLTAEVEEEEEEDGDKKRKKKSHGNGWIQHFHY